MSNKDRARLEHVAAQAGVSKSIASRILNDDPALSTRPETRERVLAAARQLHYRPHAFARGLARAESGALGLVIPDLMNPIFALISRGAVSRAAERDFAVLLSEDRGGQEAHATVSDLIRTGRIDGVILASAGPDHILVASLEDAEVPHVFVLRTLPGSARNVIAPSERASAIAVDHLCDMGHFDIGHVSGPPQISSTHDLLAGFQAQARRRNVRTAAVVGADYTESGGAEATRELLSRHPRPTGITTASATQAIGALHAAWELSLDVPREVSIVACGDVPLLEYLGPPVTAVSLPYAEMGQSAVDALTDQLADGKPRLTIVKASPDLIRRKSVGPPHR